MSEQEAQPRSGLSRHVRIIAWLVAAGLVAWFFFAWLWLDRNVLDAAGESVGSGLLLLIVVSVVGAVLKQR